MANTYINYAGDGTTKLFAFAFGYLDKTHVKVTVDGVDTAFTWNSDSIVSVSPAPAGATVVRVYRDTPKTPLVDFSDGESLTEADLDTSGLQSLYVAQESDDTVADKMAPDASTNFDAKGKRVGNVADPVDDQDAATKLWSETGMTAQLLQATTAKAAALAAQVASETAKGLSEAARDASANSATASEDSAASILDAEANTAADRIAVTADKATVVAAKGTVATDKAAVTAMHTAVTALKNTSVSAEAGAVAAKLASEGARDAALAAQGAALVAQAGSIAAQGASEAAQGASEAARDISVASEGASVVAKDAAATSETNAAASAATATTKASEASASATAAASSASASATSATDSAAARDQSQDARDTANLHKLAAEAAATSATNTAAALTGFDLEAIAESKAVTAFDVFVYDTSKDSDGGAWRKRTQGTSWYNETLNTATRGSRKEFPAVVVIVSESNKVTIYDGDDPDLPMWMVFLGGLEAASPNRINALAGGNETSLSIAALDGQVFVGNNSTAQSSAVLIWSFTKDRFGNYTNNVVWGGWAGVISTRQELETLDASFPLIVNQNVNDVAMTVLPNAPIDAATGLPVPTIAVATDGGVSVIKDDGTVVDLTHTIFSNNTSQFVSFIGEGIIWSSRSDVYGQRLLEIPDADYSSAPDFYYCQGDSPRGNANEILVLDGGFIDYSGNAIGQADGVTMLAERPSAATEGMVAYTTSTYNTGWMNGDIKGAFLSDTDDTDVVGGVNLVSSTFLDSEWGQTEDGWTISSGVASCDGVDSFEFLYVLPSVTGLSEHEQVAMTFTISNYTSGALRISFGNGTPTADTFTANGTYTVLGAVTQNTNIYFKSVNFNGSLESPIIERAEEDRSVNGKGLIVNGTVTKNPVATGADLVAYSGFSAANYLEQPYNSDLDFGTGDFSAMYWVKTTDNYYTALENRSADNASGWNLNATAAGSTTRLSLILAGTQASSGEVSQIVSGSWTHIVAQRVGTVVQFYINGGLAATDSSIDWATKSATKADTTGLKIGVRRDGAQNLSGFLALLRTSATAPPPEQIAKIYNDEKVLFQENAQATLYGTSDAVKALAHDDATNLLHVGTSAGRSVFQGLRRVDNTTTAVGTAISAANNMIVEE